MPKPFYDRPLVYVAGPYSRPDPVENTHQAIKKAAALEATERVTCFVPHLSLLDHLVLPRPLEHWYEHDLATLIRCDAVFRLPGDSSGADDEVAFALERGIPVFHKYEDLMEWAESCSSSD